MCSATGCNQTDADGICDEECDNMDCERDFGDCLSRRLGDNLNITFTRKATSLYGFTRKPLRVSKP